jgi:hypothetical protein
MNHPTPASDEERPRRGRADERVTQNGEAGLDRLADLTRRVLAVPPEEVAEKKKRAPAGRPRRQRERKSK